MEKDLAAIIDTSAEWGFPIIVKDLPNREKVKEKRFKNTPGPGSGAEPW